MTVMYHEGNRRLQDEFQSRKIADRLEEKLTRIKFTEDDKAFIESRPLFFLATADADGRPDCNHKGGMPGFVRVSASDELVFPDYDGNGMFKSLGNIAINPSVGLLFIRFGEKPTRLRVNGTAQVVFDDPLMAQFEGAQALIRLTPVDIFPNCPRYIPDPANAKASPYVPEAGEPRVEPAWKDNAAWKDVVPLRKA